MKNPPLAYFNQHSRVWCGGAVERPGPKLRVLECCATMRSMPLNRVAGAAGVPLAEVAAIIATMRGRYVQVPVFDDRPALRIKPDRIFTKSDIAKSQKKHLAKTVWHADPDAADPGPLSEEALERARAGAQLQQHMARLRRWETARAVE